MKIAYLINEYPKVSHSFIRREILALERLGCSVARIAIRGWNAESPEPEDRAETRRTRYVLQGGALPLVSATLAVMCSKPKRFARALLQALRMMRHSGRSLIHLIYLAEACLVARWVRDAQIDHLHAHFGSNPAEVAMLAACLSDRTYSFTAHGTVETDNPRLIGIGEKIRNAQFVVAVSSYIKAQLCRWVEYSHWGKVHVIHCGVDQAFSRCEDVAPPSAATLLCVGRLSAEKGQLLLIDAVRRIRDQGLPCELVLAGDGELRQVIEQRVRELDLQEVVRITGWIDSETVRKEMLASRALVVPSFAEGLPVVIMEAMLLQRPVISTYVAGIPELVKDGRTGWLVPAGDVDALAEAIKQCLQSPLQMILDMGRQGRERALERHDVDQEARKLYARFAAMLSSRPQSM